MHYSAVSVLIFDAHATVWSITLAVVAVYVIFMAHGILGAVLRTFIEL
jgi:hypothetical protein